MHYNLYATDYGDVRVSEGEASLLQMAETIERMGAATRHPRIVTKAKLLRDSCERVAKWRLDHG